MKYLILQALVTGKAERDDNGIVKYQLFGIDYYARITDAEVEAYNAKLEAEVAQAEQDVAAAQTTVERAQGVIQAARARKKPSLVSSAAKVKKKK